MVYRIYAPVEGLFKENICCPVCEELAVNIYGIPRMIAGIGIRLDFEISDLQKPERLLKNLSYIPAIPVPIANLHSKAENLIAYSSFYNSLTNYMNGCSDKMSVIV